MAVSPCACEGIVELELCSSYSSNRIGLPTDGPDSALVLHGLPRASLASYGDRIRGFARREATGYCQESNGMLAG